MQESILEQIREKIKNDGYATVITSVGQKYYIEEYHEYNESAQTYSANDENGNEVVLKLPHLSLID